MDYTLRPSQTEILKYKGGKLGISAVPGSGKTFTLSALAAQIITSGAIEADQEVLIVTLVNSAVDNFAYRIGALIQQRGLIPHLGYRVRTLHGLAHDIVREKPALAGLEDRFQIIDDREADFIRKEAVDAWLAAHPEGIEDYLIADLDDSKRDWVRRQQLPVLAHNLALAFIRSAKDRRLTPESLRGRLEAAPASLPLAEMGCAVYADYQRALAYRGAVDFDDLIRLAYRILESDDEYLARLQYRFPYILEDEAQDSSRIQEEILRKLTAQTNPSTNSLGGWVRVGDPNQAIFETFTTADPRLLKQFIAQEADQKNELPVSGRSQQHIIDLANYLIDWSNASHPAPACRDALTVPHIQAAAKDDPQPNPAPDAAGLRLVGRKYTPEEEIQAVVKSLAAWLREHAESTVAVLVPRNTRGVELIEALKKRKIDYVEYLNSTSSTRTAAGVLGNVINYLADPASASKLTKVYQVWRRAWRDDVHAAKQSPGDAEKDPASKNPLSPTQLHTRVSELLHKVGEVEAFIAPPTPALSPDREVSRGDWLASLEQSEAEQVLGELIEFRVTLNRWLGAVMLPIDQLILTLAQELFTEPHDLALAHKLALVLRQAADDHAEWRLPELAAELGVIARNERRFIGFSSDDSGFDPARHRGKVVVTTMHKAKGLEWERVYLMSVNNYDYPSLQPNDRYISERWFVRNQLNLEAEALSQLDAALATGEYDWYSEGAATLEARKDYVRERLRLFYVGITRAKSELIVTWNSGRQGDATPSLPLAAGIGWWEKEIE
jgi:DNA helicase-2/ATP-dependent DNA helicase PcrA